MGTMENEMETTKIGYIGIEYGVYGDTQSHILST